MKKTKSRLLTRNIYAEQENTKPKIKNRLLQKDTGAKDISGAAYLAGKVGTGALGIVEGTTDILAGLGALLTGDRDLADYVFRYDNWTQDLNEKLDNAYDPNKVMRFTGDVASGLGQSATFLIPGAGQILFFTGVLGNSISSASQQTGKVGFREVAYGTFSAGLEFTLEKFIGGTGQTLESITKKGAKNVTGKITKSLGRTAAKQTTAKMIGEQLISSAVGEGIEEFAGNVGDVWLQKMTGVNKEATIDWGNAFYDLAVGMASGAALGSVSTTVQTAYAAKNGAQINEDAERKERLLRTARGTVGNTNLAAGSDAIAVRLQEIRDNLEAYDNAKDKNSAAALIALGNINNSLISFELNVLTDRSAEYIRDNASEEIAEYATDFFGVEVTVDMLKDVDNVYTRALATMDWAGNVVGSLIGKDRIINQEIADVIEREQADAKARAEAEKKAESDRKHAEGQAKAYKEASEKAVDLDTAEEWNGEDASFRAKDEQGREVHITVAKQKNGKYDVRFIYEKETLRFPDKPLDTAKEIVNSLRARMQTEAAEAETAAEGEPLETKKALSPEEKKKLGAALRSRAAAQEKAKEKKPEPKAEKENAPATETVEEGEKKAAESNTRSEGDKTDTQDEKTPETEEKRGEAAKEEAKPEAKAEKKAEAEAEKPEKTASKEGDGEGAASVIGSEEEIKLAKKLVKDFSYLDARQRNAIVEMIRSGKSIEKATLSSIAHIMAIRKGLHVRFVEEVGGEGSHTKLKSGERLVLLDPSLRHGKKYRADVLFHELYHDMEAVGGMNKITETVVASTSGAFRRRIADRYTKHYNGISITEWVAKKGEKWTEKNFNAYFETYKGISRADVMEEIAAACMGKVMGTNGFIKEHGGNVNLVQRVFYGLRKLARALMNRQVQIGEDSDGFTLAFRDVLAYKRLYEVAFFKTAYGISGVDLDELAEKLEKRDEAEEEAIPDMSKRVKEMEKDDALETKRALESKTQEGRLDPRTVTRNDVKDLLEKVQRGEIFGNHYIPLRIGTPAILIEKAKEKRNDIIDNNPIAMSADKAYQAMAQKRLGSNNRPHKLTVTDMISIIEAMSDPQYIVYQSSNERYVEVVEYNTAEKKKAVAVLEIGEYKPHWTTTGYEEGLYNLLVTTFPPDSGKITELLDNKNNVIIYDKKKDASRGTPGSMVPSVSNDPSFFEDSISQPSEKVNPKTTKKSLPAKDVAERDRAYMDAVNRGDLDEAQRMVDEAAEDAGYTEELYHGTAGDVFYTFKQGAEGIHFGTIAQATQRAETAETRYGFKSEKHRVRDIVANLDKYPDSARRSIVEEIAFVRDVDLTEDEKAIAEGIAYDGKAITDDTFLLFLRKMGEDRFFLLTNNEMERPAGKRVIKAYVKAQNPMAFSVDIGEWTPYKLASLFQKALDGEMEEIYTNDDGWKQYAPYDVMSGLVLEESDRKAIKKLDDSNNFEDVAEFLQKRGIDSIRYLNTYEGTQDEESYILLDPNQVKSADPVTYDDEGKVIPLSKRFDLTKSDIRYSLPPEDVELARDEFLARAAVYRADGTVQELDEDILTFLNKLGLTVVEAKAHTSVLSSELTAEEVAAEVDKDTAFKPERLKAYTKKEIKETLLRDALVTVLQPIVGGEVKLSGKDKAYLIDLFYTKLNGAKKSEIKRVAWQLADEMLTRAVYLDEDSQMEYQAMISSGVKEDFNAVDSYRGKLRGDTVLGDLVSRYGEKKAKAIHNRWIGKDGGVSINDAVIELQNEGILDDLKSTNDAGMLIALNEEYERLQQLAKTRPEALAFTTTSAEEYNQARVGLAKKIVTLFDEGGKDTEYARLVRRYKELLGKKDVESREALEKARRKLAEDFEKEAQILRDKAEEATVDRDSMKVISRILSFARGLRDYVNREYAPVTELKDSMQKNVARLLLKAASRTKIKPEFAVQAASYLKDWADAAKKEDPDFIGDRHAHSTLTESQYEAISRIAAMQVDEKTKLTLQDLQDIETVFHVTRGQYERRDQIFREGKWQGIDELAKKAVDNAKAGVKDGKGVWAFMKKWMKKAAIQFMDPLSVAAHMDGYRYDGVMQMLIKDIANAEAEANAMMIDLRKPFEKFMKDHPEYAKKLAEKMIKLENGIEIPLGHAITLTEMYKREQAKRGLELSRIGFHLEDGKTKEIEGYGTATKVGMPSGETITYKEAQEVISRWRLDRAVALKNLKEFGYDTADGERAFFEFKQDMEREESKAQKFIDEFGMNRSDLIGALDKHFDKTDREFIALVSDFFQKTSKAVKTEADMQNLGYTNVIDGYYFPIKRMQADMARSIDNGSFFAEFVTTQNLSFNQKTVDGAKASIEIFNVWDVVGDHIAGLARWSKLYLPIQNLNKVWNKNVGETTMNVVSLKNTMAKWEDADYNRYLSDLLLDVQGTRRRETRTPVDKAVEKLRSTYAVYQLGLNPQTIVKQMLSWAAALQYISPKNIALGVAHIRSANPDKMVNYSAVAKERTDDKTVVKAYSNTEKISKAAEVTMKGISLMDTVVNQGIWAAAQYEIAEKHPDAPVGSEKNLELAGKLTNEVILYVQDSSDASTKSQAARSSSEIMKGFTMFQSSALKMFSRMVENIGFVYTYKSLSKENRGKYQKEYKKATKQLVRSSMSMTAVAVMTALIVQLFKFLYNKDREDKEGNEISFAQDLFTDIGGEMLGFVPVLGEVSGFFIDGYEPSNFFYDTTNDLLKVTSTGWNLAEKVVTGKVIEEWEVGDMLRDTARAAGYMTGIPVRNATNFVTGIVRRVSPKAGYTYDTLFYNANYTEDMNKALQKGDEELAAHILKLAIKRDKGGSTYSAEALDKLVSLEEAGYDVMPRDINTDNVPKRKTYRAFESIYGQGDSVVASLLEREEFKAMDGYGTEKSSPQATAINTLYDGYYDLAEHRVLGKALTKKAALIDLTDEENLVLVAAYNRAITLETVEITGTRKEAVTAYMKSLGMDKTAQAYAAWSLGYRNDDIRAVIEKDLKGKAEEEAYLIALGLKEAEEEEAA